MTYTALEELIGDLILEPGVKPGGDWGRYPQALRRRAVSEAERLAAIHFTNERKRALIVTRSALSVSSGIVSSLSIGPRVMRIARIYATPTGSPDVDFELIDQLEGYWLLNNINYLYGFTWYRTDAGDVKIQYPSGFDPAVTKPSLKGVNYPPSFDNGNYLFFTAAPAVAFAIGDTIRNSGGVATGTVLAVGPDWVKYTPVLKVFAAGDTIDTAIVEVPEHGPATVAAVVLSPTLTTPAESVAAYSASSCPFVGDEEVIAAGAAAILLAPEGKQIAMIYASKFNGELGAEALRVGVK